MQEITRADKRHWRSERYRREAEKSLAQKADTVATVERAAALAWLETYYANAMAAVVAEVGSQAKLELQAAEGAYRAGRGDRADLIAARSAQSSFEDRASDAARRLRTAQTMLARWIGAAAHSPLAGKPAIDAIRLDPQLLETQLAHHPQIALLAKQRDIADAEVQLAQANKKADWSVEVIYGQRGPQYSNMLSVGVSIPLQLNQAKRQDRELAAKLALAEQAGAEFEEALRAHVAETRTMLDEWQNKRERLARYARELVPLANDRTAAAVTAYRAGQGSLAQVLNARRQAIDVRLDVLALEAEAARLWAQLNFLFPASHGADAGALPVQGEKQ